MKEFSLSSGWVTANNQGPGPGIIQAGVQETIKTEMKSYSEAVQKSKKESVSLSKIKTGSKTLFRIKVEVP